MEPIDDLMIWSAAAMRGVFGDCRLSLRESTSFRGAKGDDRLRTDAAGRNIARVSNFIVAGTLRVPSVSAGEGACNSSAACPLSPAPWLLCLSPGNSQNVTVLQTYTHGQLTRLTACNPTTGDQHTDYQYGVNFADGSTICSNDLLRATIYPDSTDHTDRVTQEFNRQSERIAMTDQNGTQHEYAMDKLGRPTDDRAVTIAAGIDDAVRRLQTGYDVRGRAEKHTSHSAVTGGTIVNQIQFEFNDFGQPTREYQSHSGAVNTSTTPYVGYEYADGTENTNRLEKIIYPNGREIIYSFGSADSDADLLSRVAAIKEGTDTLAGYDYLGASAIVRCDYAEPGIKWDLSPTGNDFDGLDSLDRVIDCLWRKYSSPTGDPVRIGYTYDRSNNRTTRKVVGATGNDELYAYDNLDRLRDLTRGDLTAEKDRITDPTWAERWRLDATGNWRRYEGIDFLEPENTVDQQRMQNKANEITAFTPTVGGMWAEPAYDRPGNMTVFPQPADPSQSYCIEPVGTGISARRR